jgi:hypothetical protein
MQSREKTQVIQSLVDLAFDPQEGRGAQQVLEADFSGFHSTVQ